jgi:hypothetical protein
MAPKSSRYSNVFSVLHFFKIPFPTIILGGHLAFRITERRHRQLTSDFNVGNLGFEKTVLLSNKPIPTPLLLCKSRLPGPRPSNVESNFQVPIIPNFRLLCFSDKITCVL